ncbi:MAG: YkgJ family cysteine cluster protein [Candidatus Helarchaeota archaeon]
MENINLIPALEILKPLKESKFEYLYTIFFDIIKHFKILKQDLNEFKWDYKLSKYININRPLNKHPIHSLFKEILLNSIIVNSIEVNDGIRNIFLNKIAHFSPNCLKECPEKFGCCHSSYTINKIDYLRILNEKLLEPSAFIVKNGKFKLKTKIIDKCTTCIALKNNSRLCMVHKYKPSTCTKYPIINSVNKWDRILNCWTGSCVHYPDNKAWGTKVSPIIVQSMRDLWIRAQLICENKYEIINSNKIINSNQIIYPNKIMQLDTGNILDNNDRFNNFKMSNPESEKILEHILGIRKCKYIVNKEKTIKLLKNLFKECDIEKIYNIIVITL